MALAFSFFNKFVKIQEEQEEYTWLVGWDYKNSTLGTPRLVTCNHCGVQLSRGGPMAPKNKWHNKTMDNHLKRIHPEKMKEVGEARGTLVEKPTDLKDETARGCIPIFNLRNRKEKDSFLSRVRNFCLNEKFGWPTAILFLAPAEGWKGPSGPA